jgi:hypothetical protein
MINILYLLPTITTIISLWCIVKNFMDKPYGDYSFDPYPLIMMFIGAIGLLFSILMYIVIYLLLSNV